MTQASTVRLWRRAQDYVAGGQVVAAKAALEALLAHDPGFIHAHLVLGGIAWRQDRMADAVRHAFAAAAVAGDDPQALLAAGSALAHVGEVVAARDVLLHPVVAGSADPGVLVAAAALWQRIGDHGTALTCYQRARTAGAVGTDFRFAHATELAFNGRLDEADRELTVCVADAASNGRACLEWVRLRRQTPERNHLTLLDRRLASAAPGSPDCAAIEFARYKTLEDVGDHAQAWQALAHGNAVMAALTQYDAEREERLHARLREVFTASSDPEKIVLDGPTPIFVIGMTRSGTSLLDRLLGGHSQVVSAGELNDFARQLRRVAGRCADEMLDERLLELLPKVDWPQVGRRYLAQTTWRANGRPYFVDKLPFNWLLAGPILRALPQARVLNLVRDPMDVCFSNLRAFFGDAHGWSYTPERLVHFHAQYRHMMAHWHAVFPGRILDVAYADLVRDPGASMRRAFAFIGLAFEPTCLDLARNRSAVATLSMAQVRGEIRADAFDQWQAYEAEVAPLRLALASSAH